MVRKGLVVVSGPSGIGKNTLISRLVGGKDASFVVPLTTRAPRDEEINGRDYRFLRSEEFQAMIRDGRACHWDYTLGHYYGFDAEIGSKSAVITHALARMALRIKRSEPTTTLVFLQPSDESLHLARLRARFKNIQEFTARERHVEEELVHSRLFDHVLKVSGADDALADDHVPLWHRLGFDI